MREVFIGPAKLTYHMDKNKVSVVTPGSHALLRTPRVYSMRNEQKAIALAESLKQKAIEAQQS